MRLHFNACMETGTYIASVYFIVGNIVPWMILQQDSYIGGLLHFNGSNGMETLQTFRSELMKKYIKSVDIIAQLVPLSWV